MSDEQFLAELNIRAYIDQISGYKVGDPARLNFAPTIPTIRVSGTLHRAKTLELPSYHRFSPEERTALLS